MLSSLTIILTCLFFFRVGSNACISERVSVCMCDSVRARVCVYGMCMCDKVCVPARTGVCPSPGLGGRGSDSCLSPRRWQPAASRAASVTAGSEPQCQSLSVRLAVSVAAAAAALAVSAG